MITAGLIGSPLRRSLSPFLFSIFSEKFPEKYSYSLLETRGPGLRCALDRIRAENWSGFNVTLPLKEKIIPFLDSISGEAKEIGAVNAVRIRNGGLEGRNTDSAAVRFALNEAGCRPGGRDCVIWGAGGAARAAAWVLASGGAGTVAIHDRSPRRAGALARGFSKIFPEVKFTARAFCAAPGSGSTVFVNATPLGMYAPLPAAMRFQGPPDSCYLDFAYARGLTPFLKGRGGRVIPGLDLLIYQALKSAELFGGRRAGVREIVKLKNAVKAELFRKR
jgi:shikimate dehydrogenase